MERYDETESRWLLPRFMRADAFDAALSEALDEWGLEASASMGDLSIWDAIDTMGEADLDALAADMALPFYHAAFPDAKKRALVKSSRLIQARLGTKWAVEKVLDTYFSAPSHAVEWWDYGGEPGHFEVDLAWSPTMHEEAGRFWPVLASVKRAGAILDGVHELHDSQTPPIRTGTAREESLTTSESPSVEKRQRVLGEATAAIRTGTAREEHVSDRTEAAVEKRTLAIGGRIPFGAGAWPEDRVTSTSTVTVEIDKEAA